MGEKRKFAVSMLAIQHNPGTDNINHHVCMVMACSHDEAIGIGYGICSKLWPGQRHHVMTCTEFNVTDVDGAQIIKGCKL